MVYLSVSSYRIILRRFILISHFPVSFHRTPLTIQCIIRRFISIVFPQLKAVSYDCQQCGQLVGPFMMSSAGIENRPGCCPSCNANSAGVLKVNLSKSQYGNYQVGTNQKINYLNS